MQHPNCVRASVSAWCSSEVNLLLIPIYHALLSTTVVPPHMNGIPFGGNYVRWSIHGVASPGERQMCPNFLWNMKAKSVPGPSDLFKPHVTRGHPIQSKSNPDPDSHRVEMWGCHHQLL